MDPTLDAAQRYLNPILKLIENGVAAVNNGKQNEVTFGLVSINALQNCVMSFVKGFDVAEVSSGTDEVLVAFYVATRKAQTAAHNIQEHGSNTVIQLEKLCFVIGAIGDNPQSRVLALEELDKHVKPEMMNLPESIRVDLAEVEKAYMNVCTLAERVVEEIKVESPEDNASYNFAAVLLRSAVVGVLILGGICAPERVKTAVAANVTTAVGAVLLLSAVVGVVILGAICGAALFTTMTVKTAVLLLSAVVGLVILHAICAPVGAALVTMLTEERAVAASVTAVAAKVTAVTAKVTAAAAAVNQTAAAAKVKIITVLERGATSAKVIAAKQSARAASAHASATAAHASAAAKVAAEASLLATGAAGLSVYGTKSVTELAPDKFDNLRDSIHTMKEKHAEWMVEEKNSAGSIILDLRKVQNEVEVAQRELREVSSSTGNAQRMKYLEGLKDEKFKDRVHEQLKDLRKLNKACTDLIEGVNDAYKYLKTKGNPRVLEKILKGV